MMSHGPATLLTGFFLAVVNGLAIADAPAVISFKGIKLVENVKMKTTSASAVFRITNQTNKMLYFATRAGVPDLWIMKPKDGGWTLAYGNLCGFAKGQHKLKPSESLSWTIDANFYRRKYGEQIRFALIVGVVTKNGRKRSKRLHKVWSETIDLSHIRVR